jgi:hypothetical protein
MSDEQKVSLSIFGRAMSVLKDLPDIIKTKPTTQVETPSFAGEPHTYIVQTYRRKEEGDFIFFQDVSSGQAVQIVIPPRIADIIARQRDQLSSKSRSRASRVAMEDRMARGEKPGFMRKKKA